MAIAVITLAGAAPTLCAFASDWGAVAASAIDAFTGLVFAQIRIAQTQIEWIVLWLAIPMVLLTVYFGFINVRGFHLAWQVVRGRFRDDTAPGEVNQFQALSTALSGTVGLGNIAGVAIAISTGGPGAALWMAVIGLCAMSLKFAEVSLAVKYRLIDPDGSVTGGPMIYLQRGLAARGWPRLGLYLSVAYVVFALPSLLQIAQVNQAYSQISAVTGLNAPWGFGGAFALATAIVIFGGIRAIAKVTSRLVPLMAAVYLMSAVFILATHLAEIPAALALILSEAFNPSSAAIGSAAAVFVIGMRRAVYSCEAGIGSATIAHAAAQTREPISEGLAALLEPFIDTVVICSATALVIVVTGVYQRENLTDIQMTSAAFNSVIGGFDIVLAIAVLLFAFSTVVSWAYYMSKVWRVAFGASLKSRRLFQFIYCCALIPGGVLSVSQVFDIMDAIFFLMALPNVVGLMFLAPEIKADLLDYIRRVRSGEIQPTAAQRR